MVDLTVIQYYSGILKVEVSLLVTLTEVSWFMIVRFCDEPTTRSSGDLLTRVMLVLEEN